MSNMPLSPSYLQQSPEPDTSQEKSQKSGLRRALGWLIPGLLLLSKAKFLFSSGSILVSIAAYSLIWGWKFAAGFVALLFIHELGHVIQLRREGIQASAPMFVPFLGAVIMAKSMGENATTEAKVGLAGPILGTAAALACIPIGLMSGNDLWMALAFTGLLLNLFNLIPVSPLDGGRAMAALSPRFWFVGLLLLALLFLLTFSIILALVLILGGLETRRRWKELKQGGEETQAFYRVRPKHRVVIALVYLGLIVVCGVGMELTYQERAIPE